MLHSESYFKFNFLNHAWFAQQEPILSSRRPAASYLNKFSSSFAFLLLWKGFWYLEIGFRPDNILFLFVAVWSTRPISARISRPRKVKSHIFPDSRTADDLWKRIKYTDPPSSLETCFV